MDSSIFFPYPGDTSGEAKSEDTGFLSDFHEDDLKTLLGFTWARRYAANETAIHVGEHDRTLYIIVSGRFKVLVPSARGPQSATVLQRGDIFGELAFFDRKPRGADVIALENSEALIITPASFDRLRLAYPRLALMFVIDLGRVVSLRFRNYNLRLAALGKL